MNLMLFRLMRKYIPLIVFSLLIFSCPNDEQDNGEPDIEEISVLIPSDFAGMCHAGYSGNLDREFEMLGEMGVVWVHWDFSWSSIQPDNENQWNYDNFDARVQRSNAEGKKIMGMLLYDVNWVHDKFEFPRERRIREEELPYFVNYAVETVKRYNGKPGSQGYVDAWLIWNEPDLYPRFWTGTKEEFYALTKAAAEAIRELDENEGTTTALIGGVFTAIASNEWITGLFESGAMDQVDGIGYHPYSPGPIGSLSFFNHFKQMVEPYGFADKIWVNEMGYPTYSEKGQIPAGRYGTDQYEGDMPEVVTKTFALLAAAGAKNLTWYHLFDSRAERRENDSEDWFGLVWRKSADEWLIKGGYWGYALCANNIPGKTYKKMNFPGNLPEDLSSYYFEGDGRRTLIVWNDSPLAAIDVTITLNGRNHKLWNVETGKSSNINAVSTHTLYPTYTYQKTLIFLTWDE